MTTSKLNFDSALKATQKEDDQFMAALFEKAKILFTQDQNLSAITLQKKLLIDHPRAKRLLQILASTNR